MLSLTHKKSERIHEIGIAQARENSIAKKFISNGANFCSAHTVCLQPPRAIFF